MPLAVSATMRSGRSSDWSTNDSTCAEKSASMLRLVTLLGSPCTGVPSAARANSRTSRSPLSMPIDFAPAAHILMPLYCAGLCDAVNIAPGMFMLPLAKYRRSVLASPRFTTDAPVDVTPSSNAATRLGPDGRMSWATTTDFAALYCANATPNARASDSSNWSGTVPRTS